MSDKKNLDWKTYESITKYIYETLGKKSGVKIKGFGNNCKVTGKSGVKHQIDVLTSHSDGIHTYQTAIECKYWKEKISKDIVMKVSEIIEDANINKGVIVSKNGFTQDGINFAKYRNIGLVELREINNEDLDSDSKELNIGELDVDMSVIITRPQILSIYIGNNQKLEIEDEFDLLNYTIKLEDGSQVGLTSYVNKFRIEVSQSKKNEKVTKRYQISNGSLLNASTKVSVAFEEITFTGQLVEIDTSRKLKFALVEKVWLIMKSIFEERAFTFSENGLIIEHLK
jgi:hypothetical protein